MMLLHAGRWIIMRLSKGLTLRNVGIPQCWDPANVGIPQMLMQSWRATKPLVDLYITLFWTDRYLYWTLVA